MQTSLGDPDREAAVSGALLDADYVTRDDGRAWVRLWLADIQGRNGDGVPGGGPDGLPDGGAEGPAPRVVLDPSFEPYFYAVPTDGSDPDAVAKALGKLSADDGRARVVRAEVVRRKQVGRERPVVRVVVHHPGNVPPLREKARTVDGVADVVEADVPFAYRYIIDRGLRPMDGVTARGHVEPEGQGGSRGRGPAGGLLVSDAVEAEAWEGFPELRVMAFDLEVYNPEGMPKEKRDPIVICSVAKSYGPRAERDLQLVAEDVPGEEGPEAKDDAKLVEAFVDLVRRDDPDVIVTYNGDAFDWPYLLARAEVHGVDLAVGREGSTPDTIQAGQWNIVRVRGRANVDLYRVVARDIDDVKVKTLEKVADHLGVMDEADRAHVPKDEIARYWDDPDDEGLRDVLMEYAAADATSTLAMADRLLPLQMELARHVRQSLEDVSKMGRGRQVEWYLRAEAHQVGEMVPNKGAVSQGRYEGGFVLEPKQGVFEDVVCLDFSAMYPSIMMAYNISPDTLLSDGEGADVDVWVAPEVDHRFRKAPDGFFKRIIARLVQDRKEIKAKLADLPPDDPAYTLLDIRQRTLKILTNSFYGYMGWPAARWYRQECAEATSAWGRHLIKQVMEKARERDLEVYYGDSVTEERFVTVRDPEGRIRVRNVGELFGELSDGGMSRGGSKEYVDGGGWQALSMDPGTGRSRWSPIRRIMRHRSDKRIFRVHQKFGQTRVTEDHSLMVRTDAGIREARPAEVARGSMVRVEDVPPGTAVEVVDLLEELGDYTTSWEAWGRTRTARVYEVGDRLAFGWADRADPITVPRRIQVGSPEFAALIRLLGAYVAEGSASTPETTDTRMGATIATEDTEWLDGLQTDYERLFDGARGSVIPSNPGTRFLETSDGTVLEYDDRTYKLQMMNKLAAVFFRQLCGQGSDGKRLPSFVFNVPRHHQEMLLTHMVRGDGSRAFDDRYTETYKRTNFAYTTTSLELACGLSLLLNQLGWTYSIQYRPAKGAYTFKTCSRLNARVETKIDGEAYDGAVYDLDVEGTGTFVDSCGHVLLHNTDSLFVDLTPKVEDLMAEVNEELPLELEVDAEYEVIFFTSSKKRYAGLTKDGQVVVKGLEVRRGDWCNLAKRVQQDVIDIILRERDKAKAVEHVRGVIETLKAGEVDVEDVTVWKTLTMLPESYKSKQAHAEAVRRAMEDPARDYEPVVGAKVGYVILDRGHGLLSENSELIEFYDPAEDTLDYDYYVQKQVLPSAMRVLENFGVTENELLGRPKQKDLGDWF